MPPRCTSRSTCAGLLIRPAHHWAANIFFAAMFVHMMRVFATGAFRRPREINWMIGVAMLTLGIVEGFAGYSLPDDLLSGTGLRIAEGLMQSIPVVGTYVAFFLFGGAFPGDAIADRLFIAHVLLIPGLLLALIAAHMMILVYQKHTQWPGPGRSNDNVVGFPMFPVYAAKSGGYFFIVSGVTMLMAAVFTINPVWMYGPYDPSMVTADSQPDWYMGLPEGSCASCRGGRPTCGGTRSAGTRCCRASCCPCCSCSPSPATRSWQHGSAGTSASTICCSALVTYRTGQRSSPRW